MLTRNVLNSIVIVPISCDSARMILQKTRKNNKEKNNKLKTQGKIMNTYKTMLEHEHVFVMEGLVFKTL